jgi:hypothetical protein
MGSGLRNSVGLFLLMWLLATITVGMQSWIGDRTIYSTELVQKREALHFGILANRAPGGGGWGAVGALSIQKRVGVVYLAEGVRKITKLSIGKVYKLLDSIFLFAALLGMYFYLCRWVPRTYSLLGVLYFCAVLPLTYFFQLFHPWDRLQLAIWIVLLALVADRRFLFLIFGLFVSILIKFDTILLPFLYFLVHFTKDGWQRTTVEAMVLVLVAFGTYIALGQLFPAPLDPAVFTLGAAQQILFRNIQTMFDMNVRFPPLLVHALPVTLSLFFLRSKDRYLKSCIAFALGLSMVYLTFSMYEEVRAHMVVLVLVLPAALISVKRFVEGEDSIRRPNGPVQSVPVSL